MVMADKSTSINLLPNHGDNLLNQVIDWALTIGRLLIILTETIALGTFIYRFSLDMRIVDLHDKIKNESFIVKNFQGSEETYRNLQNRLAIAKKYDTPKAQMQIVFKDIAEMGKGRVTFHNFQVTTDEVLIDAQAPSSSTLSLFVNDLKKYPQISSININKVENKTSSALISISITANLKTAQPKTGLDAQVPENP